MKIFLVLNNKSGLLRETRIEEIRPFLMSCFQKRGHDIEVVSVAPKHLESTLNEKPSCADAIIAGGGDGTVTCAASHCIRHDKILGVLPGGTMNLFARSLGMPLELEAAAEALASAKPQSVDYGTANGRIFLHQYSVGMQPALVRKRANRKYNSRLGKILAGLSATIETVFSPPVFDCDIAANDKERTLELSMVAVSNNPHSEGHLPYPEVIDSNLLGIYHAVPLEPGASARLVSDLLLGRWSVNPDLKVDTARHVKLRFPANRGSLKALIDGEIIDLETEVNIKSHGRGLRVLKPETQSRN